LVPQEVQLVARRSWASLASATFTLLALSLTPPAPAKLRAEPAPEPSAAATRIAGCDVRRDKRVFVGFSDDMTLDDFEGAALHAERILDQVRNDVCRAWSRPADASAVKLAPELRNVLSAGGRVSAVEVRFATRSFARAHVTLTAALDPAHTTHTTHITRFRASLLRSQAQWRVIGVARDTHEPGHPHQ
jgi:hypothetical protein